MQKCHHPVPTLHAISAAKCQKYQTTSHLDKPVLFCGDSLVTVSHCYQLSRRILISLAQKGRQKTAGKTIDDSVRPYLPYCGVNVRSPFSRTELHVRDGKTLPAPQPSRNYSSTRTNYTPGLAALFVLRPCCNGPTNQATLWTVGCFPGEFLTDRPRVSRSALVQQRRDSPHLFTTRISFTLGMSVVFLTYMLILQRKPTK